MTECDEIVIAMDNLSIKKINIIVTNTLNTTSINCHSKKVRYCYVLHTVLLIMTILLTVASICCYLIKYGTKHLLSYYKQ